MVRRIVAAVILVCALMAVGGSRAQETGARVPRDLEEMLALAIRGNPEVLLAEAKLRQAEAELNQIRLKGPDQEMIDQSVEQAANYLPEFIDGQFSQVMNELHRK